MYNFNGGAAAMPGVVRALGVEAATKSGTGFGSFGRFVGLQSLDRVRSVARFGHGSAIFALGLLSAGLFGAVLLDTDSAFAPKRGASSFGIDTSALDAPLDAGWFGAPLNGEDQLNGNAQLYAALGAIATAAGSTQMPSFSGVDLIRDISPTKNALSDKPVYELGADGERHVRLGSAAALALYLDKGNYDLETVKSGEDFVPRVYVARLPSDLHALQSVDDRKQLFIKVVLPVILRVNEDLAADRTRLTGVSKNLARGTSLTPADQIWLEEKFDLYGVESGNLAELRQRADIIPPSLVLAQAAEESGWGTSRFAREGNALFGQYTSANGRGLAPLSPNSSGKFRVQSFENLYETVSSYALNLNRHRAYEQFRGMRAELRAGAGDLDGHRLAGALTRYSERGDDYVKSLRTIMRENALGTFDDVRLHRVENVARG